MRESTFIQGWIDEGKLEGFKKAYGQGFREGFREGQREQAKTTFRRLVTKQFGKVDTELEQLIEQALDVDALQRAIEAVYDVGDPSTLLL